MQKSTCYAIVMAGCIGIAGCATQQMKYRGITVDEISAIHRDGIQPVVGADIDLREQTKGKIVALRSLQIVAGILGGGTQMSGIGGPRNQVPAEGYTVTDGYAASFTTQQIAAFKGPASAEAAALNQKIQAVHVPVTTHSAYSLKTSAIAWGLDYDKLTEKNDYRLYYSINADLMDGTKHVMSVNCQGATQDMHSLDAWNANDRALVKHDAAIIGDICADKALVSMGLAPSAAPSKMPQAAPVAP